MVRAKSNDGNLSSFINYLGQLRIYSLLDLILLLFAASASFYEFMGAIVLHLAFLVYLEAQHGHKYRKSFSHSIWIVLGIVGAMFYGHIEVVPYVLFSGLYALKKEKGFGVWSSVFRGCQMMFLVAGITGYLSFLPWLAFLLLFVRNLAGDLRDVTKDKKEGLRTLPIVLGFRKDYPYLHIFVLFITSAVWWSFCGVSFIYLLFVWLIQFISYNMTPR